MTSYELCVEPQVSEIPRLIDWVEACCGAEGIADHIAFRVALALEEAVTNVIAHAFAGVPPPHQIAVKLDISTRSFIAEITDNGRPFDPTAVPVPDLSLPLEQRPTGGLGIHLMRSMVDRIEYRRRGDTNLLRLERAPR
jgi:anti-sigma regulatory factor (Ser/Thr protein kinase)